MTGFLDLSNELLSIIALFVERSSLQSLALVNKHIHHICEPLLLKHQWLHKKWAYVGVCLIEFDGKLGESFLLLLKAVFQEPNITWYIRHIDTQLDERGGRWADKMLSCLDEGDDYDRKIENLQAQVPVTSLIHDSSRQAWLNALKVYRNSVVKLFLPLLPRLRTLSFGEHHEIGAVQCRLPGKKDIYLGLKSISFFDRENRSIHVNNAIKCTWLPSLEELTATGLHYGISLENPPQGKDRCPMRKLRLLSSGLDVDAVEALLQGVRQDNSYGLQHFVYSHHNIDFDYAHQIFDGPRLLEVLSRNCSNTLTELEMDIAESEYRISHTSLEDCSEIGYFPTLGPTLKKLDQVKTLWINCDMLVDGWYTCREHHIDTERDGFIFEISQTRLCDILPKSVQTLYITSKSYPIAAKIVIEQLLTLLEEDYDEVPNLRQLGLNWGTPELEWYTRLSRACMDRGIKLLCSTDFPSPTERHSQVDGLRILR